LRHAWIPKRFAFASEFQMQKMHRCHRYPNVYWSANRVHSPVPIRVPPFVWFLLAFWKCQVTLIKSNLT
jgi:hypothetical protein